MSTDDLNNHEGPTPTLERTTEDSLEQPTDTSSREHRFIALVIDSGHMFYRHHANQESAADSGASVNIPPPPDMLQDYQQCAGGDFVSVADRGEAKTEGYGKLSLRF